MSVCGVGMGELHPCPWKRVGGDGAFLSPMFLVQKTDGVSYSGYVCGSCVATPAVQLLLILLLSQVLGLQVSDTLRLVDFIEKVFLDYGFLFDFLF